MRLRTAVPLFALICLLSMTADCKSTAIATAHKKKAAGSASAKSGINDANFRERLQGILGKGETVFLYFHTKRIKDSLKEVKIFQKELKAAGTKSRLVLIDAEKNPEMHHTFAVQYAPTVLVIKPGAGIVYTFVVDVDAKTVRELAKGGAADNPTETQKLISENIAAKRPTILFFRSDWCGYCRTMAPDVKKFEENYRKSVGLIEVDIDKDYSTADSFLVNGVPDMVVMDKYGLPFSRLPGPRSYEDIEEAVKKLGVVEPSKKEPAKT